MRRLTIVLAVVAATLVLSPGTAGAATITVDALGDGGFDDIGCILRDAVQAANLNHDVGACHGDNAGADTIVLKSGQTYTLGQHAVDDNNAKGDLDIAGPTTIRSDGPGLATIDAKNTISAGGPEPGADRVIDVLSSAGTVTLDRLNITNGFVANGVGGGGILTDAALSVTNSEITGNRVNNSATTTLGGGIYVRAPLGSLTLSGSTIAGNNVAETGAYPIEVVGGGLAADNGSQSVTMTNSTISGNSATTTQNGNAFVGGAFLGDFGGGGVPATLTNTTITGNSATGINSLAGGLQIVQGAMRGNLIAGNTDPTNYAPDCFGGPTTGEGGNLIGVQGSQGCNLSGSNDLEGTVASPVIANIGVLVNNGGLTRTHALNPGSPAIDRGGSCPATDQRGFFRAAVAPCDAGAFEVGATGSPEALVAAGLKAKLKVKRKVKVRNGPHGKFVVLTGIDASCPTAGVKCDGTASVKRVGGSKRLARASKRSKVLGKTKLSVDAGQSQAVKITLTKKASKAIKKAGELKVKISVKLSTLGGTPTVASRKAKLKPPKPKQH